MADRKEELKKLYPGHAHEGRQIVDETCDCNHLRSEHADTFALGHGECLHPRCRCRRFTWVDFVFFTVTAK